MTDKQIVSVISKWKKETAFMLDEEGYFLLKVYFSKTTIEMIQSLIKRDNSFFDAFIMDAMYAYAIEHKLEGEIYDRKFSTLEAKKFGEEETLKSIHKGEEGYYLVGIGVNAEMMDAFYHIIKRERKNKSEYSFDDLFKDAVEAYYRIDPSYLKADQDVLYEEIDKELKEND